MGQDATLKEALASAKRLNKLVEHNAVQNVMQILGPEVKRSIKEAIYEGDESPESEEVDVVDDEEDEMTEAGTDSKATIDLDKLSAEMEDDMAKEANLDIEDEDEEGDELDVDVKAEAKDEVPDETEDEEVEVSDEEIKEAFASMVKEFETPKKGDPDLEDPNTGKVSGLAAKQKSKENTDWNDVEPPEAEDFTKKEAYLHGLLARATKRLAVEQKKVRTLTKNIKEMELDQTKLALITDLFAKHPNVARESKMGIIEKFDAVKTVREAKSLYSGAKAILSKMSVRRAVKESQGPRKNRVPSAPAATPTSKRSLTEHTVAPRWTKLAGLEEESK